MWKGEVHNMLLRNSKLKFTLVVAFVLIALMTAYYTGNDEKEEILPFSDLKNLKISNVSKIGYATVALDVHNGTPFKLDGITLSGKIQAREGVLVYPIVRWKDYSSELAISPGETKKVFLTEMDSDVKYMDFVVSKANISRR